MSVSIALLQHKMIMNKFNDKKLPFDTTPFRKISEDALGEIVELHESHFWEEAPWRRKLKLAKKLYQRLETKFKLNYEWLLTRCKEEQRVCNEERLEILNMLVAPLRFYFSDRDWSRIEHLTDLKISNTQGAFLTKLARKKKLFMHVEEFRTMNRYGFPNSAIPFRPNYKGYPLTSYTDFWRGASYAAEFTKRNVSSKTQEEKKQLENIKKPANI